MNNNVEKLILELSSHKDVIKNVNKINRIILNSNIDLFSLFDRMLDNNKDEIFTLMTLLIKKRGLYDMKYFCYYEKWLYKYVESWEKCDAFCYRVLNPIIEKYLCLYDNISKWSCSDKIYVRRASLVCFIISKQNFSVDYDLEKIFHICDRLKYDNHIHIQKGLGWLLKYSYLTYPSEIEKYLRNNIDILSRTTFRYSLEKMPNDLKIELMKL